MFFEYSCKVHIKMWPLWLKIYITFVCHPIDAKSFPNFHALLPGNFFQGCQYHCNVKYFNKRTQSWSWQVFEERDSYEIISLHLATFLWIPPISWNFGVTWNSQNVSSFYINDPCSCKLWTLLSISSRWVLPKELQQIARRNVLFEWRNFKMVTRYSIKNSCC